MLLVASRDGTATSSVAWIDGKVGSRLVALDASVHLARCHATLAVHSSSVGGTMGKSCSFSASQPSTFVLSECPRR